MKVEVALFFPRETKRNPWTVSFKNVYFLNITSHPSVTLHSFVLLLAQKASAFPFPKKRGAVLQIRLVSQVYVLRKLYQGLLLSVEYHEINKV